MLRFFPVFVVDIDKSERIFMRKNWKFSYLKNQDFFIHILYQDIQDIFLKKLVVLDQIHWTYDTSEYPTSQNFYQKYIIWMIRQILNSFWCQLWVNRSNKRKFFVNLFYADTAYYQNAKLFQMKTFIKITDITIEGKEKCTS